MAHFAKLNQNNIVIEVNVVDNENLLDANGIEREELGIAFLEPWNTPGTYWKQTSYNATFRKNYAGVGYTYDGVRDAFIEPQPFPSWVLNETTCCWEPPVPYPTDGKGYTWDEATTSWVEING